METNTFLCRGLMPSLRNQKDVPWQEILERSVDRWKKREEEERKAQEEKEAQRQKYLKEGGAPFTEEELQDELRVYRAAYPELYDEMPGKPGESSSETSWTRNEEDKLIRFVHLSSELARRARRQTTSKESVENLQGILTAQRRGLVAKKVHEPSSAKHRQILEALQRHDKSLLEEKPESEGAGNDEGAGKDKESGDRPS